jgi:hypothetical protein
MMNNAMERAMRLAAVSGMRCMMGPAMLKASQHRSGSRPWVQAALAEMVLDKLGILPSRSRLLLLLPRAAMGAWVARECLREEGVDDPWAAPMGAIVAAGTATLAPKLRMTAGRVLGIPDPIMGLAEDYLALKLGTQAVGISLDEATEVAKESLEELRHEIAPALQSIGAGSM